MEQSLKTQLVQSVFKFKSLSGSAFGIAASDNTKDINMRELILMYLIADNTTDPINNIGMSDVREYLSVSKGAISQMLGALEKKEFIYRDIDRNNRRNIIVTLTDKGREALTSQYGAFNGRLDSLINRLGEHDVKEMIRIVNRMTAIADELNLEANQKQE